MGTKLSFKITLLDILILRELEIKAAI